MNVKGIECVISVGREPYFYGEITTSATWKLH
nr:MAG TPA: hypothetical protein [Caudoviricetes sp.]